MRACAQLAGNASACTDVRVSCSGPRCPGPPSDVTDGRVSCVFVVGTPVFCRMTVQQQGSLRIGLAARAPPALQTPLCWFQEEQGYAKGEWSVGASSSGSRWYQVAPSRGAFLGLAQSALNNGTGRCSLPPADLHFPRRHRRVVVGGCFCVFVVWV